MYNKQFIKNCLKLYYISRLKPNWNENDAESFSIKHILKVFSILNKLNYQPEVFPTANDSIQLEFYNSKGDYLEYEIFKNGKINKFINYANDRFESKEILKSEISNENIYNFLFKK